MKMPSKTLGYTVFRNGTERLGTANIDLPSFAAQSSGISGAGIMGEVDIPSPGHYGSQTVTINWRTIDVPQFDLMKPGTHALDFRAIQESFDAVAGVLKKIPLKISIRGVSKNANLGMLAPNTPTDGSNELEVLYIKIMIEGRTVLEYDKVNYIYIVNGVNYSGEDRFYLGL